MSFRRVNSFHVTDPAKLDRELNAIEDNVQHETDDIRLSCVPVTLDRVFVPTQSSPITTLGPDEQLTVDTGLWVAVVVLPDLDPKNFGRPFRVIKALIGPNTVTVTCSNSAIKCNGTTFPVLSGAAGVTTFYCNKYGYYT